MHAIDRRVFVLGFALAACSSEGDAETTLTPDQSAAVAGGSERAFVNVSKPIAPGSECEHGGQRSELGLDSDGSGSLEGDEVQSTQIVCWAQAVDSPAANTVPDDVPAPSAVCSALPADGGQAPEAIALKLDGPGYFTLDAAERGVRFYTRAAAIYAGPGGTIVDTHNLRVLGYAADLDGSLGTVVGALTVGATVQQAHATAHVLLAVNLKADDGIAAPWDAAHPANTSNFSTSTSIFDSLGTKHQATIYFAKGGANSWTYHVMVNRSEVVDTASVGAEFDVGSGRLTFTTDGALEDETVSRTVFDFVGAAPGQTVEFDFGDSINADGGTGYSGTTSFDSPSATNASTQDGYAQGSLAELRVNDGGVLEMIYSNGQRRTVGALALARFPVNTVLSQQCGVLWADAAAQSDALFGLANTPGRGRIVRD